MTFWENFWGWMHTSDSYAYNDVTSVLLPGQYGSWGILLVGLAIAGYQAYKTKVGKADKDAQRQHKKDEWEHKEQMEVDRIAIVDESIQKVNEAVKVVGDKITNATKQMESQVVTAITNAIASEDANLRSIRSNLQGAHDRVSGNETAINEALGRITNTENNIDVKKKSINVKLGKLRVFEEFSEHEVNQIVNVMNRIRNGENF